MSIWAGILAFLKAIPELMAFWKEMKSLFGDSPAKFLRDNAEAFASFKSAKTDEEKIDALRKIQNMFGRL